MIYKIIVQEFYDYVFFIQSNYQLSKNLKLYYSKFNVTLKSSEDV